MSGYEKEIKKQEEQKNKIRERYKGVDRNELEFIPQNQEKSCLRIQQRKGFVPIAVFLLMMLIRLLLMSCRRIIMKI